MARPITNRIVACILLWMASVTGAVAQHDHSSTHEPLDLSSSLEFSTVFEAALDHAPELLAAQSRQQQTSAYQSIGDRWITGRPSWQLNYIDDSLLDSAGLREYEAGIQVNLWRRGERSDAKELGDSYSERLQAWFAYNELLVAGRVRSTLADIAEAEAMIELEHEASGESEQLLEVTRRLFESGSVALLDTLRVESILLDQLEAELQAEAALVDSEQMYAQLTELPARPDREYEEELSTLDAIPLSHPTLHFLNTGVNLASAQINKVKQEVRSNPSLRFGVRRERGNAMTPYIDSLGVSLSVPFGGRAVVSAAVSDARNRKVDVEVELVAARRALNTQLHEVEHELFLISESLELGARKLEINEQRHDMAMLAFVNGEIDLSQVIIALQQTTQSRKELKRMQLRQQRLVVEYNQVTGVLP